MSTALNLYEADFFAWTQEQISLIKQKLFNKLDMVHLQEELQIMSASEKRELANRLAVLLMHLLKWKYQPSRQCKSWERTIKEQRLEVQDVLDDNPSLEPHVADFIGKAYQKAILKAADETNLDEDIFPASCEWPVKQVLNNSFLPD